MYEYDVSCVYAFGLKNLKKYTTQPIDYIHRIGRTGRAGATGVAISFLTPGKARLAGHLISILTEAEQPVPRDLEELARYAYCGLEADEDFQKDKKGSGDSRYGTMTTSAFESFFDD